MPTGQNSKREQIKNTKFPTRQHDRGKATEPPEDRGEVSACLRCSFKLTTTYAMTPLPHVHRTRPHHCWESFPHWGADYGLRPWAFVRQGRIFHITCTYTSALLVLCPFDQKESTVRQIQALLDN